MKGGKLAYVITFIVFFILAGSIFKLWQVDNLSSLLSDNVFNNKDENIVNGIKGVDSVISYLRSESSNELDFVDLEILKKLTLKEIENDPNDFEAYRFLGVILKEEGNYLEALENFNKSIIINPNYDPSFNSRGYLYFILGKDDLAREDYVEALEINPENAEVLVNLSLLYMKTGISKKINMIEFLNRAVALSKNDNVTSEAVTAIGVYYLSINSPRLAYENFKSAISFNDENLVSLNGLAMSIYEILASEEVSEEEFVELFTIAINSTENALEIDPNFVKAIITQGLLLRFSGDKEIEREKYEYALSVLENNHNIEEYEKINIENTIKIFISEL